MHQQWPANYQKYQTAGHYVSAPEKPTIHLRECPTVPKESLKNPEFDRNPSVLPK